MTSQSAKDYIPLVVALSEGKTIQQYVANRNPMAEMEWRDDLTPTWCAGAEFYRIKPEPPKPRRWWVVVHPQECEIIRNTAHNTKQQAIDQKGHSPASLVEVVEVMK